MQQLMRVCMCIRACVRVRVFCRDYVCLRVPCVLDLHQRLLHLHITILTNAPNTPLRQHSSRTRPAPMPSPPPPPPPGRDKLHTHRSHTNTHIHNTHHYHPQAQVTCTHALSLSLPTLSLTIVCSAEQAVYFLERTHQRNLSHAVSLTRALLRALLSLPPFPSFARASDPMSNGASAVGLDAVAGSERVYIHKNKDECL